MTADGAPEALTADWRPVAEPIVRARMAYYGYEPEQIADAEDTGQHVAACDFNGMQWECYDEDGKSNHPVRDELEQTAEFVVWVLEQLEPPRPAPASTTGECPIRCQWMSTPDGCECRERLAAVTSHTRTPHEQGPDYCADCSEAVSEWVTWETCCALRERPPASVATTTETVEYASNFDFYPHSTRESAETVQARFGGHIVRRTRVSTADVVGEWEEVQ